jgi:hypothetical protein
MDVPLCLDKEETVSENKAWQTMPVSDRFGKRWTAFSYLFFGIEGG